MLLASCNIAETDVAAMRCMAAVEGYNPIFYRYYFKAAVFRAIAPA